MGRKSCDKPNPEVAVRRGGRRPRTAGDARRHLPPDRVPDADPGRIAALATLYIRRRVKGVPPAVNRGIFTERVDQGPPPGLIAYRDGRVVGWVNLGPRAGYEKLASLKALAAIDDRPVWSIVCFVVGRADRGQGIAVALLDAAIAYARAIGAQTLEAYPADTGAARVADPNAYKGTLAMFERARFKVVARRHTSKVTADRPIVRLEL